MDLGEQAVGAVTGTDDADSGQRAVTAALLPVGPQLAFLCRTPALDHAEDILARMPAVEETLRFDRPAQRTARIALESLELEGKAVAKGQTVDILLAAANRTDTPAGDHGRGITPPGTGRKVRQLDTACWSGR
jgi:hypothetical protein